MFKRIWGWITGASSYVWNFIKAAIKKEQERFIEEYYEFAEKVVKELEPTNMTGEEKRRAAFEAIKREVVKRGELVISYLINLLIELAVSKLKNLKR